KDRLQKAVTGAAAGGVIGGALPAAGAIAKTAAAPALSNITARVDPTGYARSLVARGLDRSGMTADDVAQRLEQARTEGQGNYQLADVSPAFQRLTAGFMKAPGQAKTLGTEMLERRQANQGAELRSNIRHALDAPITAEEMNTGMRQIRSDDANRLYGLVDEAAGNVDVTPALNVADRFLGTGAARNLPVGTTLPDDSVEGIVRRARGLLGTDAGDQVFDFQTAFRRKRELDSMINSANPTQQAQLIPIRDALDQQLERASSPYANARNTYRQQSQVIEGIGEGQRAARAGLPEDTIPAFNRMERDPQSAFRVGYADTLMNDLGGAPGVNKARNLTGDYVQQELNAIALPGRAPRLLRQIERSSEMNRTRNLANGGSATA
ncbi:MAG: DUF3135 domain-containing protein, partial [Methylocystaceae bacterium]|nr:DUF3135 domain-containing protein [Methylocystaceae bacterium]